MFLLKHDLITQGHNRFHLGAKRLHLEADSDLIKWRQVSWHLEGFHRMSNTCDENLFFTSPMTLSRQVARNIRHKLVKMITETSNEIVDSPSEDLFCLNIDWFKV